MSSEKCTDNATAYNLIYEEAKISPPEVVVDKSRRRSGDAIMNKLNEAEIRRKTLEMDKITGCVALNGRIESVASKVKQETEAISSDIEKKIVEKLTAGENNYSKQIMARQEKIKKHIDHVFNVNKEKKVQSKTLKERIDSDLNNSINKRQSLIAEKIDKLVDHSQHVKGVLENRRNSLKEIEIKSAAKIKSINDNRELYLKEKTDKLKSHTEYVNKVREMKINNENQPPVEHA